MEERQYCQLIFTHVLMFAILLDDDANATKTLIRRLRFGAVSWKYMVVELFIPPSHAFWAGVVDDVADVADVSHVADVEVHTVAAIVIVAIFVDRAIKLWWVLTPIDRWAK